MAKVIILIICAAIAIWGYQFFSSDNFSNFKDSITNTIKKEKTIQTVTNGRKQQQQDAEDAEY